MTKASNLVPEPRVDKNGVVVTKHINPDKGAKGAVNDKRSSATPAPPTPVKSKGASALARLRNYGIDLDVMATISGDTSVEVRATEEHFGRDFPIPRRVGETQDAIDHTPESALEYIQDLCEVLNVMRSENPTSEDVDRFAAEYNKTFAGKINYTIRDDNAVMILTKSLRVLDTLKEALGKKRFDVVIYDYWEND